MKANKTIQRIYNLFPHPSKRFANAVGTIVDQKLDGVVSEPPIPTTIDDILMTIDTDPTVRKPENVGRIFNVTQAFTVTAEYADYFVDTITPGTTYPAGTNLTVVPVEVTNGDDETETVYKFDIFSGAPSAGGQSGASEPGVVADMYTAIFGEQPVLCAENMGRIFLVCNGFTVDSSNVDYFTNCSVEGTSFPDGTNVLVVPVEQSVDDELVTVYKFDILGAPAIPGKTLRTYKNDAGTNILVPPSENVDLKNDLVGFKVMADFTATGGTSPMEIDVTGLCYYDISTDTDGNQHFDAMPYQNAESVLDSNGGTLQLKSVTIFVQC